MYAKRYSDSQLTSLQLHQRIRASWLSWAHLGSAGFDQCTLQYLEYIGYTTYTVVARGWIFFSNYLLHYVLHNHVN